MPPILSVSDRALQQVRVGDFDVIKNASVFVRSVFGLCVSAAAAGGYTAHPRKTYTRNDSDAKRKSNEECAQFRFPFRRARRVRASRRPRRHARDICDI